MKSIGQVAAVPEDFSPLQLGAAGQFDQHPFHIVGRIRKVWDEGSWNEWCVMFDSSRFGWLAEAQGDLVMTVEQPRHLLQGAPAPLPAQGQAIGIQPGASWRIGGRNFVVTDIKQVRCEGAEGELAGISTLDGDVLSVDLRGPGLEFATVEYRSGAVALYVGRFVEFADCRFSNLRRIAGWTAAAQP